MVTLSGNIITGVSWAGALFGALFGAVVYLILSMFGIAVIGALLSFDLARELMWGGAIWMLFAAVVSGFAGGYIASRGAPGLTTRAAGYFSGAAVGALLLMALTVLMFNTISTAGRATVNLVQGVLSGVPNVGQTIGTLGIGGNLRSVFQGLNRSEIEQLVARAAPDLTQDQVSAATSAVLATARDAVRQVDTSITDFSKINDELQGAADYIGEQLSGPQLVQRLETQGLTQQQATDTANALGERIADVRQRLTELGTTIRTQAEQLTRETGDVVSTVAWMWLLAAVLLLGAATLGGGRGSDQSRLDEEEEDNRRPEGEVPPAYRHH